MKIYNATDDNEVYLIFDEISKVSSRIVSDMQEHRTISKTSLLGYTENIHKLVDNAVSLIKKDDTNMIDRKK